VTPAQRRALDQHRRFAIETMNPRFAYRLAPDVSLVLSVNSGYECIEAGSGGPVWHASIRSTKHAQSGRLVIARRALDGVGDPAIEWVEHTATHTTHLRRRLTESEAFVTGPMLDLRDTPEAETRKASLLAQLGEYARTLALMHDDTKKAA